jgi:hypothetical protein
VGATSKPYGLKLPALRQPHREMCHSGWWLDMHGCLHYSSFERHSWGSILLSHQRLGNLTTTKKTGTILLFTEGVIQCVGTWRVQRGRDGRY